jgi:hypothetical protein
VAIAGIEQGGSGVDRKGMDRATHQQIYSNVGRRTTMLHPILVFWETNENSHPRPEKASNGINAAAIKISHTGLHRTTNVESRHSGVIGCVRTFPPCKRKHIKRLCLNAARLVNAMPAPFLSTEQHK